MRRVAKPIANAGARVFGGAFALFYLCSTTLALANPCLVPGGVANCCSRTNLDRSLKMNESSGEVGLESSDEQPHCLFCQKRLALRNADAKNSIRIDRSAPDGASLQALPCQCAKQGGRENASWMGPLTNVEWLIKASVNCPALYPFTDLASLEFAVSNTSPSCCCDSIGQSHQKRLSVLCVWRI